MAKLVESSDLFKIFNSDGSVKNSLVSNDDLVFIPDQQATGTFKGDDVENQSILVARGHAYRLPELNYNDIETTVQEVINILQENGGAVVPGSSAILVGAIPNEDIDALFE